MNDEDDTRAAEYVLGTLDRDERAAFERALALSPQLRGAVLAWEKRLAPLLDSTPAVAPPPALIDRIEAALPAGQGETIVALRRAAQRWRRVALAASALAAALGFVVVDRVLRPPQASGTYVAAINRGGDRPALIVRVDLATGMVFVRPVAAETPAGKSLELWYIGRGAAPKSMGLVATGAERLALPRGADVEQATFAVTIEPEGGSPTGGPTGPVVYSGQLVRE